MNTLLKLLPSVFLISIYFIADEFLGPLWGTLCVFLLGTAEFLYTRFRYKTTDKMILLTTLLFCIPGALALWSEASIWLRLQPGITEAVLCVLVGAAAFSKTDLTAALPVACRSSLHLDPIRQRLMKQSLQLLCGLLTIHTLAFFFSVFYFPPQTTAFIGGPLLYILLGCFFGGLLLNNLLIRRKLQKEEWLPLVNEKGEITGRAPRSLCHSGSKLLHPVVHLHIINSRQEIFLQKRSMKKDLLPGMWDTAVGGHVSAGEKIEDALKRETYEEIGITDFEARFLGSYIWESQREKELVFSFLCHRHNRIHINNEEVDEGKFWPVEAIEESIPQHIFTPNFVHEYRQTLLPYLQSAHKKS